jgi:hypothetical protein
VKKTTKFARKRAHTGGLYNGAEWMNAINRVRAYDDAPPPGFYSTAEAASKAEIIVRDALQSLLDCKLPDNAEHAHDVLAHALGVTVIRALQIQPLDNPMIPVLKAGTDAANRAIERFEKTGAWGLDGPGRGELVDAVEVYATVLKASSPAQMTKATAERMKILQGKTKQAASKELPYRSALTQTQAKEQSK